MDERPDLSPDLEWMLSSSQAAPAEVRQAVAREHGQALFRLALSLLNDPDGARAAVQELLAALTDHRQRYSSGLGVRNWLYGLIVEICQRRRHRLAVRRLAGAGPGRARPASAWPGEQRAGPRATEVNHQLWEAVDGLAEPLRTPLLLSVSQRLPAADIARIVRQPEARVKDRLRRARQQLHRRLRRRLCQLRVEEGRRWPLPLGRPHLRARDLAQARLAGEALGAEQLSFLDEHLRACPTCRAYLLELVELEALLGRGLGARAAAFGSYNPGVEELLAQTEAGLDRRQKVGRIRGPVRRAALAVGTLALILAFGWLTNRLFPRSAARLPQSAPVTRLVQVAVPVTQVITPTPLPPPEPLSINSTSNEIRQRMIESSRFWRSLWADAVLLRYGPAGYIGPAQAYRNQIWFEQPSQLMVLSGPPAKAENVTFKLYNNIYEMDLRNGLTYYYEAGEEVYQRLYGPPLAFPNPEEMNLRWNVDGSSVQRLISPQRIAQQAQRLHVIGVEDISPQQLLVVEALIDAAPPVLLRPAYGPDVLIEAARYHLWLDPQTGVILRWQRFDPQDPSTVVDEVILNQLVFGVPFPEQSYSSYFFSPERFIWENEWRPNPEAMASQRFVWVPPLGRSLSAEAVLRASGEQVLIPPSAPWQSNLGQSRLTFRWDFHWDRGRGVESSDASLVPDRVANLFSGRYFLGRAELGNPWYLICERSPDGQRIVFNEGWYDPFLTTNDARWLDLRKPEETHLLLPAGSLIGGDPAFSPDSRYLAFWGCGGSEGNCGVYIQDLETRKNRKLGATLNTAYFQWSPDGQSLAMIRLLFPEGQSRGLPRVVVLDVKTGTTLYEGDFDWQAQETPADSPTRAWGIAFPPRRTGLEGCIAPP